VMLFQINKNGGFVAAVINKKLKSIFFIFHLSIVISVWP
jgi:hypothetical protein